MPTPAEWLNFLGPQFTNDADKVFALAAAVPYRPACLSTDKQDEAQGYYAAYLLQAKANALLRSTVVSSSTDEGGHTTTVITSSGGLKAVRLGDRSEEYFQPSTTTRDTTTGASASNSVGQLSEGDYYTKWNELASLCSYGGIMVATDCTQPAILDWLL